jgi:hypothetical protein
VESYLELGEWGVFDWDRLAPILAAAVAALPEAERAERHALIAAGKAEVGVFCTGSAGDYLLFSWAGRPLCRVHGAALARPGVGSTAAELS